MVIQLLLLEHQLKVPSGGVVLYKTGLRQPTVVCLNRFSLRSKTQETLKLQKCSDGEYLYYFGYFTKLHGLESSQQSCNT